jgi:hypothetical protein
MQEKTTMKLKTIYDAVEEIPEGFADLYTEKNGKFELTGVEGIKTQGDIDRIAEALRKEKSDHKVAKEKLNGFGDLDPTKIAEQAEELISVKAQLEALGDGHGLDEAKLEPIIEARLARKVGPLEREKTQLQRDLDAARGVVKERDGEIGTLKGSITEGKVSTAIRDAAAASKVIPTAVDDAVLNGRSVFEVVEDGRVLTKDNVPGVTPGLEPKEWFKDMQEKRPHWWPPSVGGGSQGGRGGTVTRAENPWSEEGWNLTRQGQMVTQHGEAKAAEMAKAVNSKLGATHPTKRAAA